MNESDTSAPFSNLILTPVLSDFSVFLNEITNFYFRHPAIGAAIHADLDAQALERKRLRLLDEAFYRDTSSLPLDEQMEEATKGQGGKLQLGVGRPRTSPLVVFIAAMTTGFQGALYGSREWTLMLESMSLHAFLDERCERLPAPNTLGPLIAAISESTQELIFRVQLADILDEGLDTFQDLSVDSTAVEASSCWPTDSSVILRLFERAFRLGGKLGHFGLKPIGGTVVDRWLGELGKAAKAIALLGPVANRQKRLKSLYQDFYLTACKLGRKLMNQLTPLLNETEQALPHLPPSLRRQAQCVIERIRDDSQAANKTIGQSMDRIAHGLTTKARERVLSLADQSAAFIEKGGRQPIIGYKAQLARSGEGFVTALILEEGNGADSTQLAPLVCATIANTAQVPVTVSTDDGYSSFAGVGALKEMGVKHVSVSGSKGRALLGEDVWNDPLYILLRNDRSAAESLMFTLKYNHRFGRLGRRGIKAARSELMFKVIAYNFDRMAMMRQRRDDQKDENILPIAA